MIKKILVSSIVVFSFSASAKEYAVAFKKGAYQKANVNKSFFSPAVAKVSSFENLEMMVVDVASAKDLIALKNNPSIEFVESVDLFKAPPKRYSRPGVVRRDFLKFSEPYPWGIVALNAPDAWLLSNSGAGVKVLVLDTGVDRDHPNLASNFVEGRDLIGGANNPNVPYPYFDSAGHGTHVAGTILADGAVSGVFGVAPRASLYVGKVCESFCNGRAIMAGIDWAIEEQMDVVNMSLGGRSGSLSGERMYQRAEDAGVTVVAASGNDGEDKISYPAKYKAVLSVGAIDEDRNRADFSNYDSDLDVVAPGVNIKSSLPQGTGRESRVSFDINGLIITADAFAMDGASNGAIEALPVQFVGLGQESDYEGVNLNGKIALVERGEISFADKVAGAVAAGASAVVIFNNEPGDLLGTLGGAMDVLAVGIDQASGQQIVEALEAIENSPEEGLITSNVQITASDFGALQGTSMATPHVAGVAALVKAANPDLTPAQVKDVIRNTAVASSSDNSNNEFGRGLVDALSAVEVASSNL